MSLKPIDPSDKYGELRLTYRPDRTDPSQEWYARGRLDNIDLAIYTTQEIANRFLVPMMAAIKMEMAQKEKVEAMTDFALAVIWFAVGYWARGRKERT